MNILILSSGTRNKIIQYFKQAFGSRGLVFAADASVLSPALYEADNYYIVPQITARGYIDLIIDICKKDKINGILSLIDPELGLLARNQARFEAVGTTVIGSSYELCERSLDKFLFYQWLLKHNYNCAHSWVNKEEFYKVIEQKSTTVYPVFVKPRRGSASIGISLVHDKETIDLLFKREDELMIQEFLDGQEVGADVYIDMISREVVSIFTKKKIKMKAGETDKAVSFKDPVLFAFIEEFVKTAGYTGQIDIDIFNVEGKYYISEVNPRFGGGYPHAYECGCDHMSLILNNLQGKINRKNIGAYDEGIYMMKYNEVILKNDLVIKNIKS